MTVGIEPLGNMVLLEIEKAAEKTSSGLLLSEGAREQLNVGRVVAVGPGATKEDGTITQMNVNIGDRVIYRKYGGTELEWNGGDFLLIKEDDLQAKVL
tara:strand:- start:170 stop:463 length:294 start_codon:yes stop_codon:yes gene_type:complete